MQEISAKILQQKIIESKIYIPQNLPDKFELNIKCEVKLKTPKDIEEKSVLLNVELKISATEELTIDLNADIIFEIENKLDNYEKITDEKLIPMACRSLLNTLDDMLVAMGYSKMKLADEIKD